MKHTKEDTRREIGAPRKKIRIADPVEDDEDNEVQVSDAEEEQVESDNDSQHSAASLRKKYGAETQDIYDELDLDVNEVCPERAAVAKAAATVVNTQDSGSNQSMLDILELLWDSSLVKKIIPLLANLEQQIIRLHNLKWKRILSTTRQGIIFTLKKLKSKKVVLEKCSFEAFKKALRDGEYYTMFMRKNVPLELSDKLVEAFFASNRIEEQSSCAATTKTITTSSTIAPTVITPADALASTSGEPAPVMSAVDILDELLPITSTQSNTGLIQQSISRKKGERLYTWTSPGETGFQVVKLDIYNYGAICNLEKKSWWKTAEVRSTFLTASPVDPVHIALQNLMAKAFKGVTNTPGVKKEERATGSSYFSNNFQRHP